MAAPSPALLTTRLAETALGLQRVLAQDPHRPEALVGISLVALASRQTGAAVQMAQAAVASAPHYGVGWVTLGQALRADARLDEAEHAYRQAIALDGVNVLAHTGMGELHLAAGDAARALASYDLALNGNPTFAAAHLGRGHSLAWLGRNLEALTAYDHALTFAPRLPEGEFAVAFVLARLGRRREAETRYRRAIAFRPDFAAAWMNLGCLLRDDGQDIMAQASLERAVELCPSMIAGWLNLALLRRDQGNPEEAEKHLRCALELDPVNVNTLLGWSQFRLAEHDLPGAWEWLSKALAQEPANAEAVNMKGILLHTEERFAEAAEAFLEAEKVGSLSAASNRGNSLMDLGLLDESLAAHRLAVQRDPEGAGSAYNLALTELRLGLWKEGWPRYESRLRFREVIRTPMLFKLPRWHGEPLEGRTVLLHAEQGLGDVIQFCRYAPLVVARGGHVVLQVHEPALRLVQSLSVVHSGHAVVVPLGLEPPAFDLECPLMSLPAVFGTSVDTVPWTGPYLAADPALTAEKQSLFPAPGLRIGVAWAGNPKYKADHRRSMRLAKLVELLRGFDANWISLQKGEAADQLTDVLPNLPADVRLHDGSSHDADLAETAALTATLDLVITTDTSIAHLAGALGKPVWILLPHQADWRWMRKIETTPWYPTARLFRQPAPGDWSTVFARVAKELARFTATQYPECNIEPSAFAALPQEIQNASEFAAR
jgi:tetratricopeptide (TPR) repeat protein